MHDIVSEKFAKAFKLARYVIETSFSVSRFDVSTPHLLTFKGVAVCLR